MQDRKYTVFEETWYGILIEPSKISLLVSCSPRIYVATTLNCMLRQKERKALAAFKHTVLYMSLMSIPYSSTSDFHLQVETRANMPDISNINNTFKI